MVSYVILSAQSIYPIKESAKDDNFAPFNAQTSLLFKNVIF